MNQETISAVMRELSHRRTKAQRKGGRPRSAAPRCLCGKMTAKLAKLRGHQCAENISCITS